MLEELLTRFGTPALILAFATAVWREIRAHGRQLDRELPQLWDKLSSHESRISRLEGIEEAHR